MAGTVVTRIGEIMKEKNITNKELVDATGLNARTIHALSRDQYERLGLDTIAVLCDALKVQPGDLFKYTKGK